MRYEAYRVCSKDWMYGKQFKDIYRNFNIRMSVEDQKIVYQFLQMEKGEEPESQKYDLNQLAKIVD